MYDVLSDESALVRGAAMLSMSYCIIQNTLAQLRECKEHIDAKARRDLASKWRLDFSPEEEKALSELVDLCEEFVNEY